MRRRAARLAVAVLAGALPLPAAATGKPGDGEEEEIEDLRQRLTERED